MHSNASELVFATNNSHKLSEAQNYIGKRFELIPLANLGFYDDIPEDHETLEENALQKVRYIYSYFNRNCFADDTGLEVEALNGRPGVHSARYAGESKDPKANIKKLLDELHGVKNRNARFRTVIALIIEGHEYIFEGIVDGKIIEDEKGADGFGYDPVFLPNGYNQTFAEMNLTQKNKISHRAQALAKLADFLYKR